MLDSLARIDQSLRRIDRWLPNRAASPIQAPPALETYYCARYPHYELAPHLRLLLKALGDLGPGQGLIVNLPPRHGKTEAIRAMLERYVGMHPARNIITASYTARLAQATSRSVRNAVMTHVAFRAAFAVRLARDSASASTWHTEAGGAFLAVGVGGSVTGFGAHLLVIDDPVKSREQAESQVFRERALDWLRADVMTRLAPEAKAILVQTRWHTHDPAGYVLEQLGEEGFGGLSWSSLVLPAIAEEDDPMGREIGEALWPSHFDLPRLENIRTTLGPYDWAALYQQQPFTKGGAIFREPARYEEPHLENVRLIAALDTASSKASSADYTALVVLAVYGSGLDLKADVLEVHRARLDLLEIAALVREIQERFACPVIVEETAQSQPIIRYMRSERLRIELARPVGDKWTRAQPLAAAWNAGKVRLPVSAPWLATYLAELTAFIGRGDSHDDQVDATAYAWLAATKQRTPFYAQGEL